MVWRCWMVMLMVRSLCLMAVLHLNFTRPSYRLLTWVCFSRECTLCLRTYFYGECASPLSVHSAFVHTLPWVCFSRECALGLRTYFTVSVLLPWVYTRPSYILCRECASPVSVHSAFVHTLSWVCFSRECKLGFVHTLPYVWMRSQTMWQFDSDTETISASRHCSRHLEMWTDKLEVISSAILYMICCHYTML